MENPFVYGEAVLSENFCDWIKEIKKFKRGLMDSQKIFLISSRKLGKTSIIINVLNELKKEELITIYIDIEAFSSYKEFLEIYLLTLIKETTTINKILTFICNLMPGLRIELKFDESGKPLLSLSYSHNDKEFNRIALKIYDLPGIISEKKKKRVVVAFDEFQEILKFNGKNIEGSLRASIQHQRNVGYIFAGSKRHLLNEMVNSPQNPFYKIGPVMFLKKIEEKQFFEFIKEKFISTKFKISDETLFKIIEKVENIPYYIQMICHELWNYKLLKKEISIDDIEIVIDQLVRENSQNFHIEWSRLILNKRRLLKAIAIDGGKNVLSSEYIKRNELDYPSSVQRTLKSLIKDGYLDQDDENNYYITDLLFREWIRKLHI